MEKKSDVVKRELLNVMNPLGRCKHGLMRCTCGVCTKHPMSVAVKGGHVSGTSSSSPAYIGITGIQASQQLYDL